MRRSFQTPLDSPVPPATDEAARRKARDAALKSQDEMIADHLAQAYASGELQGASSFGKPMPEAEGWAQTPLEFRLPFKILKNAGMAPPEVALFQRRASLRDALAACADPARRTTLMTELGQLEQAIALRLEGMRASGRL